MELISFSRGDSIETPCHWQHQTDRLAETPVMRVRMAQEICFFFDFGMELLWGRDLCFWHVCFCSKHLWDMNFLDGFFLGEGLRPPSSMGIKCPFCLRQLDFLVLGAPQVDGHYLSQRLFFVGWFFVFVFFWDLGGFLGARFFLGGWFLFVLGEP